MATRVTAITWTQTGGTLVGGTYHLPVGATISLTLTFQHVTGTGSNFNPANGDYIVLSNGGHAVYSSTSHTWVYTVATGSTAMAGVDYAGNGASVIVYNSTGTVVLTSSTSTSGGTPVTLPSAPATAYDVICFMAGTMIATPGGEVAVEDLKAGDLVTLATGGTAKVSWLGRQTISTVFADPQRTQPVRILANALADGVPSRDLLVSPDHALLVDGVLVHAAALINGVSVAQEAVAAQSFVYYHVELAEHGLILAENTPAETFIDNADRMAFDNWADHPGNAPLVEMTLPRAKAARQVPAATSARLLARGEMLYGRKVQAA